MNGNTPWRTVRGGRLLALSQGRNDWYRIKNRTDGPTQLHIYDEIGFLGVTAADLIRDLADVNGPIDVHINSPGGEVYDGLAIYNTLLSRPGVEVYIDGIAASIASVIAMAGTKIHIAPTAQMMVHNAFTMAVGDAKDLRAYADRLEESTQTIATIYAGRTGKPAAHWLGVMDEEGWYRGQQAIDAGLADCLIQAVSRVPELTAKHDTAVLAGAQYAKGGVVATGGSGGGGGGAGNPYTISAGVVTSSGSGGAGGNSGQPSNAASHPYHDSQNPMHEPMTGMHAHNHAAFGHEDHDDGIHHHAHQHTNDAVHDHTHMMHDHDHDSSDMQHHHAHNGGDQHYGTGTHMHTHHAVDYDGDGDDDTTAAGDTDHDYVLPDGNPGPKAGAGTAMARADLDHTTMMHVDLHNASYDDSAWDGSAAMSAAAKSKNPASALSAICAGRRSGDASTEAAHALPHHKSPGSPPNRHGVDNALARLNQTQGLTNKSAAEAHLKAHASAWEGKADGGSDSLYDKYTDEDATNLIETLRGVH